MKGIRYGVDNESGALFKVCNERIIEMRLGRLRLEDYDGPVNQFFASLLSRAYQVPEKRIDYVWNTGFSTRPDRWEWRVPAVGDTYVALSGSLHVTEDGKRKSYSSVLDGYRWCKLVDQDGIS